MKEYPEFPDFKFDLEPVDDPAHNHKVLKVSWSNGLPLETIIADLEKEDWNPYGMETKIDHNLWQGYRYKVHRPKSPMLQRITQFFRSEEAKRTVIDALYKQKSEFHSMWGMFPEKMMANTQLHAEFTKDLPGFENGVHCDYRLLVATGVVYLADKDDPNLSSEFYDNPQRDNPYRVKTGFGTGWVHGNDWNTWHDGWNRTDKVRYSMLLGLTLKLVDF